MHVISKLQKRWDLCVGAMSNLLAWCSATNKPFKPLRPKGSKSHEVFTPVAMNLRVAADLCRKNMLFCYMPK